MLPIFWDEETDDEETWEMELGQIEGVMERNREYYLDMSWGKMTVEYETLQQQSIGVSKDGPSWDDTSDAARVVLNDEHGYEEGVDYDSIGLVYNLANSGPFSGGGGWGCINCGFLWMSYRVVSNLQAEDWRRQAAMRTKDGGLCFGNYNEYYCRRHGRV